MKYILIEHADGNDPKVLRIFDNPEERAVATREAILGQDNKVDECRELLTLAEEGIVHFEGDPSIEWVDAEVEDSHAHLLERIKVLDVEVAKWKDASENLCVQLTQRDAALKCSLEFIGVLPVNPLNEWLEQRDILRAQIHACGINGEAKEHPAVARVKELEVELKHVHVAFNEELSGLKLQLGGYMVNNNQLTAELERRNRELLDPPADIQELVIKKLNLVSAEALTQRDNALKLAGRAVRSSLRHTRAQGFGYLHPIIKQLDRALAAIKACGVEL